MESPVAVGYHHPHHHSGGGGDDSPSSSSSSPGMALKSMQQQDWTVMEKLILTQALLKAGIDSASSWSSACQTLQDKSESRPRDFFTSEVNDSNTHCSIIIPLYSKYSEDDFVLIDVLILFQKSTEMCDCVHEAFWFGADRAIVSIQQFDSRIKMN